MNAHTSPSHRRSTLRSRTGVDERAPLRGTGKRGDSGFTLIELLIVIMIIPLIAGALGYGLVTVFSLQAGVSSRLGDSSDAQIVAASFTKDVQGASSITTTAIPLCGPTTQTQLLGLEWGTGEAVSDDEQLQTGTTYSLVRNDCGTNPSVTPASSTTLSYDLLPPCPVADAVATCTSLDLQPVPVATWSTSPHGDPTTEIASTVGMSALQFSIAEPKSSYMYNLSATPVGETPRRTWEVRLRGTPRAASPCPVPGRTPQQCASSVSAPLSSSTHLVRPRRVRRRPIRVSRVLI